MKKSARKDIKVGNFILKIDEIGYHKHVVVYTTPSGFVIDDDTIINYKIHKDGSMRQKAYYGSPDTRFYKMTKKLNEVYLKHRYSTLMRILTPQDIDLHDLIKIDEILSKYVQKSNTDRF